MTTALTCHDAEELIAAFALDALERDESVSVALHLVDCRRHDAELAELRAVVSSLPEVIEPLKPPPGLRASVLGAFEAAKSAPAPEPVRLPPARPAKSWLRAPGFAYGMAAALLVLVVGLAAWAISLQDEGASSIVNAYEVRDGDSRLTVVHLPADGLTIVTGDMSPLPSGRVYQAWLIGEDGTPRSLGVMPASGPAVFRGALGQAQAVAVTVEPDGGSTAPTSEPVLVAKTR